MTINKKKVYILILFSFLCLLLFKSIQYNALYKTRLSVYYTGIGAFNAKVDYIQKINTLLPKEEQENNLIELHRIVSQSDIEDLLNARTKLNTWNVNVINDKIEEIKKVLFKLDGEYERIYKEVTH